MCYFCKKFNLNLVFGCKNCKTIKYCSQECMSKDSKYHKIVCRKEFDYIKRTDCMEEFHLLLNYPNYEYEINDWSELQEYLNKVNTQKYYNINFIRLTVALTFPFTFINGLRKFEKFIDLKNNKKLNVHFLGTSCLDFYYYKLMYSHIAKYYSKLEIEILLVGADINTKSDELKNFNLPKNYKISYRKEYYQNVISDKNFVKPDVICIFHPGYNNNWTDVFKYAVSNLIPTIISGYEMEDIRADLVYMRRDNIYPNLIFEDLNHFRMLNEDKIPEDFMIKSNDKYIISNYINNKLGPDSLKCLKEYGYNKFIYGFIGSIDFQLTSEMKNDLSKLSIEDEKLDEKYKFIGNNEFYKGNYLRAIDFYSQSVNLNKNNHIYYSNRSQCYLNIHEFELAYNDSVEAVNIDPKHLKSHVRRIESCLGNLNYFNAKKCYLESIKIFPNQNEILKLKDKINLNYKPNIKKDLPKLFMNFINNIKGN